MTDLGESFKVAIKEAIKEELQNFMKEAIVPEKQGLKLKGSAAISAIKVNARQSVS